MGFYVAEIRKLRWELKQAYEAEEYKKAIFLCKRILQLYLEQDACDTIEYASDMHNMGVLFDQLGMYRKAAEYYQKAAVLKRECSGESLSYADTLNNLAIVYNHLSEAEKAQKYHEKVLRIREAKLGEYHMDTIHSLLHLGNTYEDLSQFSKGLEYHKKALEKACAAQNFPQKELADIFAAMACSYDAMGNYKKAIAAYEKALDLYEKEAGEENFQYMILVHHQDLLYSL